MDLHTVADKLLCGRGDTSLPAKDAGPIPNVSGWVSPECYCSAATLYGCVVGRSVSTTEVFGLRRSEHVT